MERMRHARIMDRRRPRLHYGPQASTPALWTAGVTPTLWTAGVHACIMDHGRLARRLKKISSSDLEFPPHNRTMATVPSFRKDRPLQGYSKHIVRRIRSVSYF